MKFERKGFVRNGENRVKKIEKAATNKKSFPPLPAGEVRSSSTSHISSNGCASNSSSSSNSNGSTNLSSSSSYLALSIEASGGLDSGFSDGTAGGLSDGENEAAKTKATEQQPVQQQQQQEQQSYVVDDQVPSSSSSFNLDPNPVLSSTTANDNQCPSQNPPPPGESNPGKADDDDKTSELSGVSDLSGTEWKSGVAGPFSWIQRQMSRGVDPRELLKGMITADSEIPEDLDPLTLWKIILNILSEPPKRDKLDHVNTLEDVVRLIRSSRNVMVLTGAGVSVSCGIPDFRSRDGVYARLAVDFPDLPDPQAMFDINYFKKDPRPFFKFAREIYPGQFAPSPCHRFIRSLERHGKLLRNYTQNIDTLEQVVGIEKVVQCHGSFATASCMKCKHRVSAHYIKHDIFNQVGGSLYSISLREIGKAELISYFPPLSRGYPSVPLVRRHLQNLPGRSRS